MRALLLALLAVVPAGCVEDTVTSQSAPSAPTSAQVVRVVDGDTLEVALGGARETVRLIGVDAPERDECYWDEATAALLELVEGRELELAADTSDRDRYGRLLRYVFAEGRHVNAELVLRGAAVARDYPPDTERSDELHDAESEARGAGRGLWTACPDP